MPYDQRFADLMRNALRRRRGVAEKRMFGGYCWMLNGNMLCGVEVGRYMFRVGPKLEQRALQMPGASPMDLTGRPMRGFVWVKAEVAVETGLKEWINLAARFVGSLPAK